MDANDRLIRTASADLLRPSSSWAVVQEPAAESPSLLTWEQAVRVLRKHRWFLGGFIGGVTLAIVAVALLLPDVYRPTARLEIDPVGGGITTLHEIDNSRAAADLDYLDTQVQILQSEGLAMRVIRALHLDKSPEFASPRKASDDATQASHPPSPLLSRNQGSYIQEQLELATMTPAEAAALQTFRPRLSVNPVRGSRLVEVSFTSQDPRIAQAVANSLVLEFMDQNYRNRYVTTMEASDWLSSQLNDLRQKVTESRHAVSDYQKRYGLVESDDRDVPLGQFMGEVSRQLSDAQADRIQAEASVRLIDEGRVDAIPSLRDDVVYQNLVTRYAEVRSELAQAQTIYGDENTNVKKLKGQAEELTAQVDAERQRLINRVRSSFEAAKAREQMVAQSREKLRAQMGDASSHLVEYGMLKNEAMANAALYNTLQTRLREAGIYAGLRSENIRVVDMAPALLKPTGPHRGLLIGLGASLSVILAVAIAFIRESFDNTVRIPDDVRNWVHLPSLAVVPRADANKGGGHLLPSPFADTASQPVLGQQENFAYPKLFWSKIHTAEGEAIRTLRTAVLSPTPSPRVILVTSPSTGEGKSTIALNLASVLAQQGSTCLIEGDLRRPMIAPALGLIPRAGLSEVLAGTQPVADALTPAPGIPGLTVLAIKDVPDSPADVLASENLGKLLNGLCEQFEHLVIDSPPVLSFSDALTLASISDGVVLVSQYGYTTRRAVARSAELLAGVRATLLGVVLNGMDMASADYHYFNYGYSWSQSGRDGQVYKRFVPPVESDAKRDEKSKGAHA